MRGPWVRLCIDPGASPVEDPRVGLDVDPEVDPGVDPGEESF